MSKNEESERQMGLKEILRPLIPILKVGRVECSYALRLTPTGKYTFYDTQEFLRKEFDDYIIVKEESKKLKEHFHAILFTKMYEEEVREKVRTFLKLYFTEAPKRGDANRQYNLSEIEDLELALTYILKDGGTMSVSDNISQDTLDSLKKKSYKKFSKEDFAKALELLKTKFKEEDSKIGEMMVDIIRLKALYRQPVNITQIYQMCLGFYIHQNPSYAKIIVEGFLSRLQ